MTDSNFNQVLRERTDAFVASIRDAIRKSAVLALTAVMEGTAPTNEPTVRLRVRRSKRRKVASASTNGAVPATDFSAAIVAHVAKNPGLRLEEIGKGLKAKTAKLKAPIRELLDAKQLKKTGQRRGTRYFAREGKAKAAR